MRRVVWTVAGVLAVLATCGCGPQDDVPSPASINAMRAKWERERPDVYWIAFRSGSGPAATFTSSLVGPSGVRRFTHVSPTVRWTEADDLRWAEDHTVDGMFDLAAGLSETVLAGLYEPPARMELTYDDHWGFIRKARFEAHHAGGWETEGDLGDIEVIAFVPVVMEEGPSDSPRAGPNADGAATTDDPNVHVVTRQDLNTRLAGDRYIDVSTCASLRDVWVRVVIQQGGPVDYDADTYRDRQTLPYSYEWQLRDEGGRILGSWLARFVQNRDFTYHTIVRLPPDWLKKSFLLAEFEEGPSYLIDMTGYEWDGVRHEWVRQALP